MNRAIRWGSMILAVLVAGGVVRAQTGSLSEADQHAVAEANKYMERANKFVQDNSYARAKAEYLKALKVFPQHLDALYNLAVVCGRLNENEEAVRLYQRYLELRPHDADVWTQLGVCYDEMNRRLEAQAAYEKALAANPKFGRAHHNLGIVLEEQGKLDQAQEQLETFLKLEEASGTASGDAYYSLGTLHLRRGQIKQAKLLLQKAVDFDPSVPHYNNAMGDVYLAERNTEMAVVAYKKAIERAPKYAPAWSGLGDAYRVQGEHDKAATAYHKALELRSDYALVHYKLGLLEAERAPAEAIKHFEIYLASGKNLQFVKEANDQIEKLKQTKPSPPPK